MTCEKLIQIAITISTTFTASPNHCQGARLTWNQGFTSSGFEQQVGWRFACTGTIFFSKLTSAFAWTRLLGAGVLPPRHLARQLTSSRSATSLHLSAHYLLRSVPLKQRLVQCTYLKGQADKLFLKCILEQYRPALEILGLRHGAGGGGIIHRQTSRSESESFSLKKWLKLRITDGAFYVWFGLVFDNGNSIVSGVNSCCPSAAARHETDLFLLGLVSDLPRGCANLPNGHLPLCPDQTVPPWRHHHPLRFFVMRAPSHHQLPPQSFPEQPFLCSQRFVIVVGQTKRN